MVTAVVTELWRLAKRNRQLRIRLLALLATAVVVLALLVMAAVTLA